MFSTQVAANRIHILAKVTEWQRDGGPLARMFAPTAIDWHVQHGWLMATPTMAWRKPGPAFPEQWHQWSALMHVQVEAACWYDGEGVFATEGKPGKLFLVTP